MVRVPGIDSLLAKIHQSHSDVCAFLGDLGHGWPSHISASDTATIIHSFIREGPWRSSNKGEWRKEIKAKEYTTSVPGSDARNLHDDGCCWVFLFEGGEGYPLLAKKSYVEICKGRIHRNRV